MTQSYAASIEEISPDTALTDAYVQERIAALIQSRSKLRIDLLDTIRDADWISGSITSSIKLDGFDQKTRFFSSADFKFEDTSIGGNYTVNPLPQFTRYADPRSRGMLQERREVSIAQADPNLGMGQYYAEAYDDTKQIIHMRFGIPEYNSLVSFFTGFFDNNAARLAKSGSIVGDFTYIIGRAAGFVLNIIFWPLLAAHSIGRLYRFFAGKPASKFYYLRPTMSNYWTAVTTMLNQILVYRRILPVDENAPYPAAAGQIDASLHNALQALLPGIYTSSGFVDVYKIANRAQKILNHVNYTIDEETKNMTIEQRLKWAKERAGTAWLTNPGEPDSLEQATERWAQSTFGRADRNENVEMVKSIRTPIINEQAKTVSMPGTDGSMVEIFNAEFEDGTNFATFRVDYTGSVDESFSNSTAESDISSKFNDISAKARAASFSFAGGNIDGGLISGVVDAAQSLISGALTSMHLSGLLSLGGAAFVDIPKHWDNSTANLPKMNYTMQLVSPYGNPISQLINIHLPLCMLLAAALPISTGSQSYTSPFILELHDRGKAMTRLGMIDSLSIVRGTTNLGFNKQKAFMSADVSFSVVDLSSVMHMPLSSGMFGWRDFNPGSVIFGEDTVYSDYLHVLAGASLQQAIYKSQKLKDNAKNYLRRLESLTSADRWMMWLHDTPVGLLDAFYKGTER